MHTYLLWSSLWYPKQHNGTSVPISFVNSVTEMNPTGDKWFATMKEEVFLDRL